MKKLLLILLFLPLITLSQIQVYEDILPSTNFGTIYHKNYFSLSFHNEYKIPEWTIHILTKDRLRMQKVKRVSSFTRDNSVQNSPDYDDYRYSGYDRGHLVPAGSFKYSEHQRFIYSYLNCAIMHKDLNQGVWKTLENRERKLSKEHDVKVQVTLLFSDENNTVDAGATIPSSFRKKIEYRKKGKMDFKNPTKIITEIYEFPNNDSVKNTNLNSYKVKSI